MLNNMIEYGVSILCDNDAPKSFTVPTDFDKICTELICDISEQKPVDDQVWIRTKSSMQWTTAPVDFIGTDELNELLDQTDDYFIVTHAEGAFLHKDSDLDSPESDISTCPENALCGMIVIEWFHRSGDEAAAIIVCHEIDGELHMDGNITILGPGQFESPYPNLFEK
jgi:hypothetical protein